MEKSKEQKLVDAMFAPLTIGDIQLIVKEMDPNLAVFSFAFGDLKGSYSWKRKETWSQWCKKQPPPFVPPARPACLSRQTPTVATEPSESYTKR
jgi:hypothetical protein